MKNELKSVFRWIAFVPASLLAARIVERIYFTFIRSVFYAEWLFSSVYLLIAPVGTALIFSVCSTAIIPMKEKEKAVLIPLYIVFFAYFIYDAAQIYEYFFGKLRYKIDVITAILSFTGSLIPLFISYVFLFTKKGRVELKNIV
jgi:hypothetical protein